MKASKRAIMMWFTDALSAKSVAVILILFIAAAWAFFYIPKEAELQILYFGAVNIGPYVRLADFFLFAGLGVAILGFILKALLDAFTKHYLMEYELGPESLKIVRGLFSKEESYIPYKNIQSADIRVAGSEFLWGLADVLVFTSAAGDKNNPESAEGFIEGLRYKDAVALKDELLKRAK